MLARSVCGEEACVLKPILVVLASSVLLLGCEMERGGGGGEQQRDRAVMTEPATPGENYEQAYTNAAQAHANLVQGDWENAKKDIDDVRKNLQAMGDQRDDLPAVVVSRVNAMQREAHELEQMIDNRNPAATNKAQSLVQNMVSEASMARIGTQEGGGAGPTGQEQR